MYPDLAGSGTISSAIFSARITFRSQQRKPKPKSSCSKQAMATGIASLGGLSAPTKEHQNINSSSSKHTMPLFYGVERTVATERATKGHTNSNLPAWQPALLVYAGGPLLQKCHFFLQRRGTDCSDRESDQNDTQTTHIRKMAVGARLWL